MARTGHEAGNGTGSDEGCAPARQTYQKAGDTRLPVVLRYENLTRE
ncbi:MAG: GNAT family N-acetyltransferase [Planctomycetota bacterium]